MPAVASATFSSEAVTAHFEALKGETLVVSAFGVPGALTHAELALEITTSLLQQFKIKYSVIRGTLPPAIKTSHLALLFNANQWIRAGQLFEEVRQHSVENIICCDPWAGFALAQIQLAGCKTLIADVENATLFTTHEHGQDMLDWLLPLYSKILRPRDLLALLPTTSLSIPAAHVTPMVQSDKPILLIEDAEDSAPNSDLVKAIGVAMSDQFQTILLTPHPSAYTSVPIETTSVLRHQDLERSTYMSLIQSAQAYVVIGQLPFGQGPLHHLKTKRVFLPRHAAPLLGSSSVEPYKFTSAEDLLDTLRGNSKDPGTFDGWFRSLPLKTAEHSSLKISIVTCCYMYLQRLRVFLNSLVRQTLALDDFEICIAIPGNPDGIREYLHLMGVCHPKLQLKIVDIDLHVKANRGKMINFAAKVAAAPLVMLCDCDIVLPQEFLATVLKRHGIDKISGCWRTPLSPEATAHILTGNLDPINAFDQLKQCWDKAEQVEVRQGILGYCQIVSRDVLSKVPYPEEFNQINQSDIVFVDRLRESLGIQSQMLEDMHVLHLAHSRNWAGTTCFL